MKADPIVSGVRRIREALWQEAGCDDPAGIRAGVAASSGAKSGLTSIQLIAGFVRRSSGQGARLFGQASNLDHSDGSG